MAELQDQARCAVEGRALRNVLGRFATGVTVITVMADGQPRGMTANAFMSGSLNPPLVMVSVAKSARTHAAIEATGTFGVSILAADQRDFASCFAGRDVPFGGAFEFHADIPVIGGSLAWLVAHVHATHVVGDHTVFVGEVQRAGVAEDGVSPLTYYGGTFCGIGELDRSASGGLNGAAARKNGGLRSQDSA